MKFIACFDNVNFSYLLALRFRIIRKVFKRIRQELRTEFLLSVGFALNSIYGNYTLDWIILVAAHLVGHINYLSSGNCWHKRWLVACCSCRMAFLWHLLLHLAWRHSKCLPLGSCQNCWHWANPPPLYTLGRHPYIFVCFSISERALFIRKCFNRKDPTTSTLWLFPAAIPLMFTQALT